MNCYFLIFLILYMVYHFSIYTLYNIVNTIINNVDTNIKVNKDNIVLKLIYLSMILYKKPIKPKKLTTLLVNMIVTLLTLLVNMIVTLLTLLVTTTAMTTVITAIYKNLAFD